MKIYLAVTLLGVVASVEAFACGCGMSTKEERYNLSEVVATVKIVKVSDDGPEEGMDKRINELKLASRKYYYDYDRPGLPLNVLGRVLKQWKGQPEVNILFQKFIHSCYGGPTIGDTTFVFARRNKAGRLELDGCGWAMDIKYAKDEISWLNKHHPIKKK